VVECHPISKLIVVLAFARSENWKLFIHCPDMDMNNPRSGDHDDC
jgi:hypothetical protein